MSPEGGSRPPGSDESRSGEDEDGEASGGARPDGLSGSLRRNQALREMLERARRVVSDSVVTEREAADLHRFLEDHPELLGAWSAGELKRMLRLAFADDELDAGERDALLDYLKELIGEDPEGEPRHPTKLESSPEDPPG